MKRCEQLPAHDAASSADNPTRILRVRAARCLLPFYKERHARRVRCQFDVSRSGGRDTRMCKQHLILAAVLAVGGMAFTGCGKQEAATDTNSTAAPATQQTTGQKIGSMIDATTQKVTDAATQASGVVSSTGADSVQGREKRCSEGY